VGILEPNSFHYKCTLNQVTEATLTFPFDAYDDLPELMDGVRIYRNGMCVWDGVVLRAKENYENKTCELYCLTSSYVLQRILDLTKSSFVVLASVDTAVNIKNYVYGADGAIAGSGFKQQGFGIYDTAPCGFSSETIPEYYTIPKSEFVHPWDYITSEQDRIAFDFEIRPPFVFNYWEPQKGRDLGIKLLQDVHFKVGDREKSGHNLDTACRATSRGAGASFVDDDSDATAMNTYARLVKLLSTQAKSQTEVEAMSTAWVAEYKTPATTLDIELLSGGWIYPWGLGDTIIWIIRETEYEKRIMAFDVMVDSKGEKVKVALQ
jgi:hypothetical protein